MYSEEIVISFSSNLKPNCRQMFLSCHCPQRKVPLNSTGLFVSGECDEFADVVSVAGSERPTPAASSSSTTNTTTTAAATADERPKLQVLHMCRPISTYPNGMAEHQSGRHELSRHALPMFEKRRTNIGEQLYGFAWSRAELYEMRESPGATVGCVRG